MLWPRLSISIALLAATGCATPVGVNRAEPREVYRTLDASAVSGDVPSASTRELLTRLSLNERFEQDPGATLLELHRQLAPHGDLDRLFSLAELSFLHAERTQDRQYALAAVVYAYAFLFGEGRGVLDPFDPRIQIARQLYNRALTLAIAKEGRNAVTLERTKSPLPFGSIEVEVPPEELTWAGRPLTEFAPVAYFQVRGLDNRYRKNGIGAPLAASFGEPATAATTLLTIPRRLKVPITAFVRIPDPRAQLASGHIRARLEIYDEDDRDTIEIGGERVPIELEKSSSFAYMLEGAPIYDFGLEGFRLGDYLPTGESERLMMLHPYRPGRIPLVLVHGTFSSPATWAQLVNELENDPEVSQRFQIWLFIYNSGNPVAYSAGILASTLRAVVAELDPDGTNRALRNMVIAGHSQGGLLTKLMAVRSGDTFWRHIARKPIDQVQLDPDARAMLQRSLFYEPLPFVKRVVFMSTPHHGSYLSDFRVVSWISRLVKLPARLTKLTFDIATRGSDEFYLSSLNRMPTSLDNMASRNPFLQALAGLPIDPGVAANSIIAVQQEGLPKTGGDGVVRYESAHIDGVESELVVRSGHSVQETQEGIQELRRILLHHVGQDSPDAVAGDAPGESRVPSR